MGFRFQKRINLGKGFGMNISKSGITPSYRGKSGSVSTKGYSVRTGISGMSYRKTYSKTKNGGCLLVFMLVFILSISNMTVSCKNEVSKPDHQWYHGGTLHDSKIMDWKNATEQNKLATCGDFCAKLYPNSSLNEIEVIAMSLRTCINEATKDIEITDNSSVAEIASLCLVLLEQ